MRTVVTGARESERIFRVKTPSQASFQVEAGAYARPGEAAGPAPTELLLASLVTCAGSTLEAVIEKMRLSLLALNVVAVAQRREAVPRVFTAIALDFHVASAAPETRLQHAIEVTERTCSVSVTLSKAVPISPRLVHVRQVDPAVTRPLRRQVLRPHQTLDELVDDGESAPGAAWFAAMCGGDVVGTAGAVPQPSPDRPDAVRPFRLRAMATADEHRGVGLGRVLLAAAVAHARAQEADLLWCSARAPAEGFYRSAGFESTSEAYDVEHIGRHVRMALAL